MVDRLGVKAAHPADVIGALVKIRQELVIHPHSALALLGELVFGGSNRKPLLSTCHGGQSLAHPDAIGKILVIPFTECRLVVEQVHLGRPAHHVKVDHPFCLWSKVCLYRSRAVCFRAHGASKKACECSTTKNVFPLGEKVTTRLSLKIFLKKIHGKFLFGFEAVWIRVS